MTTWKRYLSSSLLKTFFGILFGFYALYVMVDYSNRAGAFHSHKISVTWLQWSQYYLFEFLHRADVLVPFALLVATMKTLLSLNVRNELVALQCGGVSTRRLLQPFAITGIICTLLLYVNQEFLIPRSLAYVKVLNEAKRNKPVKKQEFVAQSLPLKDGSFLIYQNYEPAEERFFDVFWVRSIDEIVKMKYLYPHSHPPQGVYVEFLHRNSSGNITLLESAEKASLNNLVFNKDKLQEAALIPELQPMSSLWKRLPKPNATVSPREAQLATAFYQKATLPWLCLIAVLLPAPFCIRFNRNLSLFLLYCAGIFSFISFYLFMDALTVLARRQLADPAYLIIPPIAILLCISLYRYK